MSASGAGGGIGGHKLLGASRWRSNILVAPTLKVNRLGNFDKFAVFLASCRMKTLQLEDHNPW